MRSVVSNTRHDRNASFTEAKDITDANYGTAVDRANIFRCLWPAQLRTADHRYWTVKYEACFIFERSSCSTMFFKLFSCYSF